MLFCPKCGSILMPKSSEGKKRTACKCGYTSKEKIASIKEKIKPAGQNVQVVHKEQQQSLPSTEAECPKCGHGKAFYWTMQTRAADEGETKFLKCAECNYTWRDYG